ncbi:MAG: hypothetical protein A4E36_00089 [Methanoregulaceae archaeon PtaB.Bin009]|jgi:hypothetical protein|nr:MAG: hypothetical protein A4E36_00089 [Methanoregulaceae archaeon PtaB.Bin009]OPY42375.1 MAG: hypothetical protein A4E41_00367 [Methanoregulaceae archaeon PtaU1.Bin066]
MTPTPRPIDAVPENREQAVALLKHYEWDISELTREQREAIRKLYNLDEYGEVARA